MERVTADELRDHATYLRRHPVLNNEKTSLLLEKAAKTIDEMDKDIAVFESRDDDNQQGG